MNTHSKSRPAVSIITVCYNSYADLKNTLENVAAFKNPDIEYIVIDGLSSDGSHCLLEEFSRIIDKEIREKDGGIYDAMNKGIKIASGEYINFLNAGDLLIPNYLDEVIRLIRCGIDDCVLYSDHLLHYQDLELYLAKEAKSDFRSGMTLCHQSEFTCRRLFESHGPFTLKYRLASDYEFNLRLKKEGIQFQQIDMIGVIFKREGASTKFGFNSKIEAFKINAEHFGLLSHINVRFLLKISRFMCMEIIFNTLSKWDARLYIDNLRKKRLLRLGGKVCP